MASDHEAVGPPQRGEEGEEQREETHHRVPGSVARMQSFDGFKVKTITFLGRRCPILLQNEFGPCALLGLVNVLLLRNLIKLSTDHGSVSLETVVTLVAERLLESNRARSERFDEVGAQSRRALDDAIRLLPEMEKGLDVNVRFAGETMFEFTAVTGVFDLCDVSLVHGWLCDPDDTETAAALGQRGYNQLIERFVQLKEAAASADADPKVVHECSVLDDFLNEGSQLTYYGITRLHASLRDNELAVLYRNMHFSTLFKYRGSLYVLVTDLGYASESNVVWEKLDDIQGDTELVDAAFKPKPRHDPHLQDQSLDPDFLVALQLSQQDQQHAAGGHDGGGGSFVGADEPQSQEDADFRAALQLQLQLDDQHQREQSEVGRRQRGALPRPPPRHGGSGATASSQGNTAGGGRKSSSASTCLVS